MIEQVHIKNMADEGVQMGYAALEPGSVAGARAG